jgi:hypothetical protein
MSNRAVDKEIHQAIAGEFIDGRSSYASIAVFQEVQRRMMLGEVDTDSRASLAASCDDR